MLSPASTFTDDLYRYDYAEEQVSVLMDRVSERRSAAGITCELTIDSGATPAGRLYGPKNFNLMTSSKALANELTARRDDVDWSGLLTQVSALSVARWREGEPVVDLAEVEMEQGGTKWLIPDLVESRGVTVIAAGGGTGKSYLSLACALTVATGVPMLGIEPAAQHPVLYLDWESEAATHAERAQALWAGAGKGGRVPPMMVMYRRQVASMADVAAVIKRQMVQHSIGFVVVDSIGMARGDDPVDAEATIRLFTAMRSLNVPVLAIDHMSKEVLNNPTARKEPIGSVYTTNSSRRVWVAKSDETNGAMAITLRNVKANNGRLARSLGYEVEFVEDALGNLTAVTYTASSMLDLPPSVQGGRKWEIAAYVKQQDRAVPVEEIAHALGMTDANVRTVLNRNETLFARVSGGVSLLDRGHPNA